MNRYQQALGFYHTSNLTLINVFLKVNFPICRNSDVAYGSLISTPYSYVTNYINVWRPTVYCALGKDSVNIDIFAQIYFFAHLASVRILAQS